MMNGIMWMEYENIDLLLELLLLIYVLVLMSDMNEILSMCSSTCRQAKGCSIVYHRLRDHLF